MRQILAAVVLIVLTSFVGYAQQPSDESAPEVKTTSAYSMLVLRKVAVEAELKAALDKYTSEHPSVQSKQFELDAINSEMEKMMETPAANLPKLTSGYGTLILRKVKLESEMKVLQLEYTSDHPTVKLKEVELNLIEHEIVKMAR